MTLLFSKKNKSAAADKLVQKKITLIEKDTLTKHKRKPSVERRSTANTTSTLIANNQDSQLNGIGPYEFLRPLGNGKFSRVLLAHHLETKQQVAIKIIDKQAHDYRVMSRLVREITIMELIQHDSIVKLYETFESCDSLYLVMEYVPGFNLDEYLQKKKDGALDEHEARHLFRQLVTAVDYCHRNWVVHRDLKTPNILITPDGSVKLADFGLGNRYGLQRLRTICGSMLYYSPEIITGQKYYGPEVDCWCLGITLFRMTAGFEPFAHAHTVGELKSDVCKGNFPMPSTLSPELQTTIRKCLQVDKRKRMTVRQALKDDPWLTNFGELPCPISNAPKTLFEEAMVAADNYEKAGNRDERTRRQFLRDEQDSNTNMHKVKKTIIYHPLNPSIYYTSKTEPCQMMNMTKNAAGQMESVESLRSELLQSVRSRARRLGIKPADRWELRSSGLKLFLSALNPQQIKKDNNNNSRSISEVVHRIAKDQVYHFHFSNIQLKNYSQGSRPPSLSSSISTSSISSSIIDDSALATTTIFNADSNKKHLREVMALLKQTCQLMGITYMHDTSTTLQCVLTLRSASKKSNSTSSATTLNAPSTPTSPSSPACPIANTNNTQQQTTSSTSRQSRKQSQTSSLGTNIGGLLTDDPTSRSYKRLSLPLLSHLTSSMTTSFFGRSKPRHSMEETVISPFDLQHHHQQSQKRKQKEGMALFTITIEANYKKRLDKISLRFSKQQGSTTVFKIASGWVTGVMVLDGKFSGYSK
ncbi:kinase-like domain-containing protein [Mycotypha africana]|uniref:kinase-like domain-containing protein n=1 Tax=Mycotypha africana TaxID=64632 RepID=UPI0022FFD957|nr:kinase-like domain-containing protein [Mycotypha africana]KAI8992087.1 kinase-like domain-containing protein [Mycotypha africana]